VLTALSAPADSLLPKPGQEDRRGHAAAIRALHRAL